MVKFDYDEFLKEKNRYLTVLSKVFDKMYLNNHVDIASYSVINDAQELINEWAKVARQIPTEIVKCKRRKGSTPRYRQLIKEYEIKHERLKNHMILFLLKSSY